MPSLNVETWRTYAQAFAFMGNSLLKPMTQTSPAGLEAAFWRAFPDFGSDEVRAAAEACARFAEGLEGEDPAKSIEGVSVEYTKLFVGPPKPAAPPWETMYRSDNVTVGFGDPTFEMRGLLREAGLQLSNENNQYEDHMGIELLYLSTLCQRVADLIEAGEGDEADELAIQVRDFASDHPLAWADAFAGRIEDAFPGGYFSCVIRLCEEALRALAK